MTQPMRQSIDVASLERFLKQNVAVITVPVTVTQFGFGQSNPTYKLSDSLGNHYVLRKKPPGILVSQSSHDVAREYRILNALQSTDVPVPRVYCLCEDNSVIGTPFYIMSFLDGRIFEDPKIPEVSPEDRTEMWFDATRTLASLHRLDHKSLKLSRFGRPSSFYKRQIATFVGISDSQSKVTDVKSGVAVGKIPYLEECVKRFKQTIPEDRATVVHGDYKIDNLVFHKTEPRVIGILDWELSTIGHPLSDLVNLTVPFLDEEPTLGIGTGRGLSSFKPGVTPGLPSRAAIIQLYRQHVDWDPAQYILWGDAFGMFRATVIIQGIAARYARRQASSASAKLISEQRGTFAEYTYRLVQKLSDHATSKTAML